MDAAAACPGERDKMRIDQQAPEVGELALAPDETGQLDWEIRMAHFDQYLIRIP